MPIANQALRETVPSLWNKFVGYCHRNRLQDWQLLLREFVLHYPLFSADFVPAAERQFRHQVRSIFEAAEAERDRTAKEKGPLTGEVAGEVAEAEV